MCVETWGAALLVLVSGCTRLYSMEKYAIILFFFWEGGRMSVCMCCKKNMYKSASWELNLNSDECQCNNHLIKYEICIAVKTRSSGELHPLLLLCICILAGRSPGWIFDSLENQAYRYQMLQTYYPPSSCFILYTPEISEYITYMDRICRKKIFPVALGHWFSTISIFYTVQGYNYHHRLEMHHWLHFSFTAGFLFGLQPAKGWP